MKTIILIGFAFLIGVTFSPTQAKAVQIKGKLNTYIYPKLKRTSRWCKVMQASTCVSLRGVEKYAKYGCIDDVSKESKCLKIFCLKNCAWKCDPQLARPCQTYCSKVSLGNYKDQKDLHNCHPSSLTPVQAAKKDRLRLGDSASANLMDKADRLIKNYAAQQARDNQDAQYLERLNAGLNRKKLAQKTQQEEILKKKREQAQSRKMDHWRAPNYSTGWSSSSKEPTITSAEETTSGDYKAPYVDPYQNNEEPEDYNTRRGR